MARPPRCRAAGKPCRKRRPPGCGAVIFTNGANGSDLRDEVRMAIAHAEGWKVGRALTVPAVDLAAEALREFTGVYSVQLASTLTSHRMRLDLPALDVSAKDGRLRIGVPGDDEPGG